MPLSEFKRKKFQRTFHVLDNDDSGYLDWDDFANVAYALKTRFDWADDAPKLRNLLAALRDYWARMLEFMDSDGDGQISLLEYLVFYERFSAEAPKLANKMPAWALDMFQALHHAVDADNDGCISVDEYEIYLKALGSDADAARAFAHIDLDGDGYLDVDEVEQLFSQYLVSEDPKDPGNWFIDGGGWD